jgi:hypothetical protein
MDDREVMRMFYAGLAMLGMLIRGVDYDDIPAFSNQLADMMLEEDDQGLAAIKKGRK